MYRLQAKAGAVDTVPFGAFHRDLVRKIGGFDETLLANEDYEFNTRIRNHGEVVWLDPLIRSTYVARSSYPELAKQYWRYGFWKLRMLSRYPTTLRWRQALPPMFVFSLLILIILSTFERSAIMVLFFEIFIYFLTLMTAGIQQAIRKHQPLIIPGLMLAILTMHLAWGSGFLWSLVSLPFKKT
jgi:GT2 family glycosyltransferase